MANAEDIRPDEQSAEDPEYLRNRIADLNKKIAEKETELSEKDQLLEQYWDSIQAMRITNRIKKILTPWAPPDVAQRNFKKSNKSSLFGRNNGVKICIKSPVYNWKVAHTWGDFHFAISLRKQLVKLGYRVMIQPLNEWYNDADKDCEVILVLRGLTRYKPHRKALHIMWNISHPEDVSMEEYNSYDHVFVASEIWTEEVRSRIGDKVTCLLQCTDPDIFKRALFPIRSDVLFVGNSKGIFRPILKDLLPTDLNLQVYGSDWENIIDRKYLRGSFIDHHKLYRYYSGAKILLNDHWEDMRRCGFISNRIFDGLACGAFIISDEVAGLSKLFGSRIATYSTSPELRKTLTHYLDSQEDRLSLTNSFGNEAILKHSFASRAIIIDKVVKNLSERDSYK